MRKTLPACRASLAILLLCGSALALCAPAFASVDEYLENVRGHESTGNYGATTNLGTATGGYQFTAGTLKDMGLIDYDKRPEFGAGEWEGVTWNDNPWGVSSREEFLSNAAAQDAMMAQYTTRNWNGLDSTTKGLLGQNVNGMVVDEAGLLAGAHFLGAGGMNQFASCGFQAQCIDPKQAAANNMTPEQLAQRVRERMADVAGMDVSELADGSYTPGGGFTDAVAATDISAVGAMPVQAAKFREVPPFQGTMSSL